MQFRRFHYSSTDSTSERAFASIATGRARHGDVHVADAQTAGHGRFGRPWHSPAGEGLYLSAVFLPPPPPWRPGAVTVAAALAVRDAVLDLGREDAWIDWPNDVMVGTAKLAGVIVETRGLDPAAPHFVVGIGVNVRHRRFPRELLAEREVASLALLGVDVTVVEFERKLLECLSRRIEQIDSTPIDLELDFVRATGLANREVRVSIGDTEEVGRFAGFSFTAGLLLHYPAGREKRFPLEFVRAVERL